MITARLYGLLRIQWGIREVRMEAETVLDVLHSLEQQGISPKELSGCVFFVNGHSAHKKTKLKDGDTVAILSPVAGG